MITTVGQSKVESYNSGTFNGVTVQAFLEHGTANTSIAAADFDPTYVTIKAVLKRNKEVHVICQDNVQVIGTYAALNRAYHEFLMGYDKKYAASGVKARKVRTVTIPFASPIRLSGTDELKIEVSVASGAFSSSLSSTESHVDFWATPCIGYELGIPQIVSEVVSTSASKQSFNIGDNVTRLAFLNFDKNDFDNEVITNLNLTSDRWDMTANFNQLLAHQSNLHALPGARYGSTLPIPETASTGRAFRGLDHIPQSVLIFDGQPFTRELDKVRLDLAFNSAQVAASKNYVVYSSYKTSAAIYEDAMQRQQKHFQELGEKIAAQ